MATNNEIGKGENKPVIFSTQAVSTDGKNWVMYNDINGSDFEKFVNLKNGSAFITNRRILGYADSEGYRSCNEQREYGHQRRDYKEQMRLAKLLSNSLLPFQGIDSQKIPYPAVREAVKGD
jgi:hypothetical protein